MLVKLTYFKPRGKYYSDGEYETQKERLSEIWEEIEEMYDTGHLPRLVDGPKTYIVLVDVPDHVDNHPHLIMPAVFYYLFHSLLWNAAAAQTTKT